MTATIIPPDTIEAGPARRTAQPIPATRLVKVELRSAGFALAPESIWLVPSGALAGCQ